MNEFVRAATIANFAFLGTTRLPTIVELGIDGFSLFMGRLTLPCAVGRHQGYELDDFQPIALDACKSHRVIRE